MTLGLAYFVVYNFFLFGTLTVVMSSMKCDQFFYLLNGFEICLNHPIRHIFSGFNKWLNWGRATFIGYKMAKF